MITVLCAMCASLMRRGKKKGCGNERVDKLLIIALGNNASDVTLTYDENQTEYKVVWYLDLTSTPILSCLS